MHLVVKVTTTSQHGIGQDSRFIDWKNSSDRKWLMSHMHWALNNQHSVTLTPESN